MPNMSVKVKVDVRGPVVKRGGSMESAMLQQEINEALANEAYRRVHARLSKVLVNPTGFYQANIVIDRSTDNYGVSDGGVAYGGWLEGVDSRNATTRFKGYHTFRLVRESIARDTQRIAQPIVDNFTRRMR